MDNEEYTPRFAFEITKEQKSRAAIVLSQFGVRRAIFSKILDDVLDMIEHHGPMCLGILMSEDVKPREIIPSMARAEEAMKNG